MDLSKEMDTDMIPRSNPNLPQFADPSQNFYFDLKSKMEEHRVSSTEKTKLVKNNKEGKSIKKLFPMKNTLTSSNLSIKKPLKALASDTANEYQIGYNHQHGEGIFYLSFS